ncbi:hypothetical protein B0H19DRAFT_1256459 [Mycena capillaripes]|nr:hypothetical protein B0H19DRAFT_1256459 [Mycena capillaripes]
MRFTTVTSFVYAAALLVVNVRAGVMAWNGLNCNLAHGDDAACNGDCLAFSNRKSFQDTTLGGNVVRVFTGSNCDAGTEIFTGYVAPGACMTVDPGKFARSFSCVPPPLL